MLLCYVAIVFVVCCVCVGLFCDMLLLSCCGAVCVSFVGGVGCFFVLVCIVVLVSILWCVVLLFVCVGWCVCVAMVVLVCLYYCCVLCLIVVVCCGLVLL